MDTSRVVLFYEKCRLCLDKPGACCMFETEDLPQDIYSCTGVKVSRTDNLPQKICKTCAEVVSKAKELRLVATKNDSHLKSLFGENDEVKVNAVVEDVPSTSKDYKDKIKENKANIKKKSSPDNKNKSCENNKPKTISIRKDLFESSAVVKVSKRVRKKEEFDATGQRKRIKWDTDAVQFVCEMCSKEYVTWKKLYLHMRHHNKTLACPLDACGKKFATKGDLEKHLRTHTGVKPYQCHICEKCFAQQVTLKAHMENMHNVLSQLKND